MKKVPSDVTSNYVMKMIHRKIHCLFILICRMMDIDNDDVIEAKSPVRKSKRD